jgi:hypothetical protein
MNTHSANATSVQSAEARTLRNEVPLARSIWRTKAHHTRCQCRGLAPQLTPISHNPAAKRYTTLKDTHVVDKLHRVGPFQQQHNLLPAVVIRIEKRKGPRSIKTDGRVGYEADGWR